MKKNVFWLVWSMQSISTLGTLISSFALTYVILEKTRSPFLLSLSTAAAVCGMIYLAPLAGAITSRWGHRRAALLAAALSTSTSTGIASVVNDFNTYKWLIFALVLAANFLASVTSISLVSSIRLARAESDLLRISALVNLIDNSSVLAGPVLGAALFPIFGPRTLFALDAATYAGTFFLVLFSNWGSDFLPNVENREKGSISQGFSFIMKTPKFRNLQILYFFLNSANGLSAAAVTATIFFSSSPHGKGQGWWVATAQFCGGLGALVAGVIMARFSNQLSRSHLFIFGLILASLIGRELPLFSTALVFWCVAMFARNLGLQASGAPVSAVWQEATPIHLQASVAGARKFLGQGAYPLAVLLGGWMTTTLTHHYGRVWGGQLALALSGGLEVVALLAFVTCSDSRTLFATEETSEH